MSERPEQPATRHEPPAATRHETPHTAGAGPVGATRHEPEQAAGPAETRHEPSANTPSAPLPQPGALVLPPHLTAVLDDLRPMAMAGGEAQVFRVRDSRAAGTDRVLKVYHPQLRTADDVAETLQRLRSPHVVTLYEHGATPDGRAYELMEFVPDGSLRDAGAGSKVFGGGSVRALVQQLAEGLGALHAEGITHRDLKPENVMVRGRGSAATFVLTDFGLSRVLRMTSRFTTQAMTDSYAAPESWAGHVSPARDWWSLGMIVMEMATGVRPFEGLDRRVIQLTVTTKPVSVDAVTDPRVRMLCAGLLVMDTSGRWGAAEVRGWLMGGSPGVPDRRVRKDITPFVHDGAGHTDAAALAVALARSWKLAADRYPGRHQGGGAHWAALKRWLVQFEDLDHHTAKEIEDRRDAIDELDRSAAGPHDKLVRLLATLNPAMPPVYGDLKVDKTSLRGLARQVADGDHADPKVAEAGDMLTELWRGRLLAVLARFDGATWLQPLDDRWQAAVRNFHAARDEVRRRSKQDVFRSVGDRRRGLAAMAELALGVDRGTDWFRELTDRSARLPVPVPWLSALITWAGRDPVRAFAVLATTGAARAQADQVVRDQRAALAARQARQHAWEAQEARRLAGRGSAFATAFGGASILLGLWLVLAVVSGGRSASVLVAALVVLSHYVTELSLAAVIGEGYHPRYSLIHHLKSTVAGGVGRRMGASPRVWVVVIIALVVLLSSLPAVLLILAAAAAIGHAIWAFMRHRAWQQEHHALRHQALHA